jgi:hypothetical protein
MSAVLPSSSTSIVRTGAGVATGTDLATIWGCVTTNADMTPRLWFDGNALETFHGSGQLLDQVSVFIQITRLPVLVVPLPISTPGIIRWQSQAGTGTSPASVVVGSDGSLEHVDGMLRVVRGGTVGTDQLQLEYSLDGGNNWRLFRLGTATSFTIPRIGQVIEFGPGTLVTGEEILSWTSTAPTPDDADIATARGKLAEQGNQSRAWYMIRDMKVEQDITAYKLAVDTYDTTDKRPLQAYSGLRRAFDRTGYKAQMSQIRWWMVGGPEITFASVGPPSDTITRDAGSFLDDGMLTDDTIVVTGATEAANNVTATPASIAALVITLDTEALAAEVSSAISIYSTPSLEFTDGAASPDLLTRTRGSWIVDGFEVGDSVVIVGTSNDGTYVITALTATVMSFAEVGWAVPDEIVGSYGVSVTASVVYPVDVAAMDAEFATVTDDEKLEISYGRLWYPSPTTLTPMRLRYPVALADMCRSFTRDLAETTWEQGNGSLQNWGMIDLNGIPFEYDERIHNAALPSEFTCGRTWNDEGPVPYIARALTRYGGNDAVTQSQNARVTQLGRRIVQVTTTKTTGAVFTKRPPDEQGRQFLTPDAIGTIESKVNRELARQMLGTTRGGAGPRVSGVSWTAARDDDFAVQNPVLNGSLSIRTLAVVVTVNTIVEVT